ncbi:MAG: ABC transporter substrate-binding protein [Gemmatimonadota bacterium]
MSRRRRWPAAGALSHRSIVAAAAWLLAAACGGGEPRSAVEQAAAAGGTLRIPLINDPIFDPVIAPDLGSILPNKLIFPGLVRPDEALRPTPDLAESWTISDDGLHATFTLRPGVLWHDGAPFSAEDVKFTFDAILDLASGSRLRSDFAAVQRVVIEDSLTVRFDFHAPFAPFLTLLGYNAGILPKHLLQGAPLTEATDFNRRKPVGTGPFMVTEVAPGASVTLVRNPHYYGSVPKLDRVVFKVVPDLNAQVAQLRAGELDLVTLEPANLASVQGVPGVEVLQVPVVQHFYVGLNVRRPAFRSPDVRRALGMAINRPAIIDGVLRGYADLPRGTIPVVLKDYFADALPPIPYAPDSSLVLLARAGWRRGADGRLRDAAGAPFAFELLLDKGNPTREQSALAVQQDLGRIGVTVTLRTMEFAALVRDRVLPGTFDATLIWWTTPPDPDQFAFYHTGQDNNNVGWSNPVADSLLALGRATLDVPRRQAIYRAFQRLEMEDPPVMVLFYPREIQAVTSRLVGFPSLGIRDALRHSERFALRTK